MCYRVDLVSQSANFPFSFSFHALLCFEASLELIKIPLSQNIELSNEMTSPQSHLSNHLKLQSAPIIIS